MPIIWEDCYLCSAYGRLTIGENYNKFFQCKNVQCPLCKGHTRIAIKSIDNSSFMKKREDYL